MKIRNSTTNKIRRSYKIFITHYYNNCLLLVSTHNTSKIPLPLSLHFPGKLSLKRNQYNFPSARQGQTQEVLKPFRYLADERNEQKLFEFYISWTSIVVSKINDNGDAILKTLIET